MKFIVNAPVGAWFDMDRYSTLGGLVIGLPAGAVLGVLTFLALKLFTRRGKAAPPKHRHLLRPARIVVAVCFIIIVFAAQSLFLNQIALGVLQSQLEDANGATVDIAAVEADLSKGQCTVKGIQLCDPDNLDRNLAYIDNVHIVFGMGDLLRRRFVVDAINVTNVATDTPREEPGERLVEGILAPEVPPPKTLHDFLERGQEWKKKIKALCEAMQPDKQESQAAPSLEHAAARDYTSMRASYLVEDSPSIVIKKITVNNLALEISGDEKQLDVVLSGFTTNTRLTGVNPTLTFFARDHSLSGTLALSLAPEGSEFEHAEASRIDFNVFFLNSDGTPNIMKGYVVFALGDSKGYKAGVDCSSLSLADFAGETSKLSGKTQCQIDISGTGEDLSAMRGEGFIGVVDGDLGALPFVFALHQMLKIEKPEKQVINECHAKFSVEDKTFKFAAFHFSSESVNFFGKGNFGFDESMDMTVFSNSPLEGVPVLGGLLSGFTSALNKLPVLGGAVSWFKGELYAVHVGGNFNKPAITPLSFKDTKDALGQVADILSKTAKRVKP